MDEHKEKLNPFIEPIVLKKKRGLNIPARLAYRRVMRNLDKISPSFNTMWNIHGFLQLIRYCYMYDNNSEKFHLFLATAPSKNNKSAAMIYKEDGFSITYVLRYFEGKKEIGIEINRSGKNMAEKEQIKFFDGEFTIDTYYDEEKFLFITSCLMNGLKELIKYYYENKRF